MENKIHIRDKWITPPTIVNELKLMMEETGKTAWDVIYELILEKSKKRIIERDTSTSDVKNMNALRFEINRVLDNFQKK